MTQYLAQKSLAILLGRAFLLGVFTGAVYSLFGIRRAAFRKLRIPSVISGLLLHLEDFLICVCTAILLSVLYFATTSGVLRLMAIPALAGGLIVWRLTAGRVITASTDRILRLLERLFRRIVRWCAKWIVRPIGRFGKKRYDKLRAAFTALARRRRERRQMRSARRMTKRYRTALVAAAAQGMLPTAEGSIPKTNKRRTKHTKKERTK